MVNEQMNFNDKLHWYKDAVIYELHIKAFRDSNGDGIGDFKGLLQKLDYLQELGVTAIWLLPFYPSPLKDDGYDIADYYNIHSSYGNIEEFRLLLKEAHRRQLKVITELVINHTSDQHPWFQRARHAPMGSDERNYYVWSDDPDKYKDVRIIFQDFETSNWSWDAVAQQYYWHRFFHHQPDLNYDSPLVQEEIFKVMDYWCEMGVDGFRLDAIPYLYEREGTNGENLPETHTFLKKLRKHVDENYPGTVLLAEANMWPEDSASYFGDGDECHMNYHFPVMPRMFMSLQMEDQYPITDIFAQTPEIPDTCQWAIFLRNHDELTLEMVTDEERDYMYKVYAKDPKARINLGIRHRLAPLMENNRRKIELMNSLLFSLPGTPVIYYGDEIGMGDNFYLGDRDGVRTPMQWSPDRNAGFSETNPQQLYLPVILDPEYHYETVNVETQSRNTSSLFWYMKSLISVRKKYKALSRGKLKFLQQENPKVLAFTRTYEEETLLVVVNFSKFSQAVEIDLSEYAGYIPEEIMSRNQFPAVKQHSPYFFTLSAHVYYWFSLKPLKQETILQVVRPSMILLKWDDITHLENIHALENKLLRSYLPEMAWFDGKYRSIHSVRIREFEKMNFNNQEILLLLIEVDYERGLPELYQLSIAFIQGSIASKLIDEFPEALIADLKIDKLQGWLCDAYFIPDVQQQIGRAMLADLNKKIIHSSLKFSGTDALLSYLQSAQEIKTKIHPSNPALTCIAYDNRFLLKIYRKLDKAINPDLEITRYLSERSAFKNTPVYSGVIEWRIEKNNMVLGIMENMVENHGNGYTFMLERFNNYIERILAAKDDFSSTTLRGSLSDPVAYETLPEDLQILLGSRTAEMAKLFGKKTAEMHLALAANPDPDFKPEDFSLHYQRSLFSSMQTLMRETFQNKEKNLGRMSAKVREEAASLLNLKQEVLNSFRDIYAKKLNMVKIRIHGNMHLKQILLMGKDVAIHDFLGNTNSSFSERRLRRSPMRDVVGMLRSFHNVAYEGVFQSNLIQEEDQDKFVQVAILWSHYITGFFMKAYLDEVKGSSLLPESKEDLKLVIRFFLLRKAMHDLNDELKHRPDWAIVPLRLIKAIVKKKPVHAES